MLSNRQNLKIISVESRKGGVGKTTLALKLGEYLQGKGWRVVLLDLDLTGTNAAKGLDGNSVCEIVKVPGAEKDVACLATLFEDWMAGGKLPDVAFDAGHSENTLSLQTSKVNVIGSEINHDAHLLSPASLYDSLHAQWFRHMLEELIERILDAMGPPKTADKLAVILDNSPGYSGLQPELEDWLTTLGPEIGKFLFVATLDRQDLAASGDALTAVWEKLEGKLEAARLYDALTPKDFELKEDLEERCEKLLAEKASKDTLKKQHKFFKKLSEGCSDDINKCGLMAGLVDPKESCCQCGLCYYSPHSVRARDGAGKFKPEPFSFIKFVINKVPSAFNKDAHLNFDKFFSSPKKKALIEGFVDSVVYSNFLQFQFIDCAEKVDAKFETAISRVSDMCNDTLSMMKASSYDVFKSMEAYHSSLKAMRNEVINVGTPSRLVFPLVGYGNDPCDLFALLLNSNKDFSEKLFYMYSGSSSESRSYDRSQFRNTGIAQKILDNILNRSAGLFGAIDGFVNKIVKTDEQIEWNVTIAPYVALLVSFWEDEPRWDGGAEYFSGVFAACEQIARNELKLDNSQAVLSKDLVDAMELGLSKKIQAVSWPPAPKASPESPPSEMKLGNSILDLYKDFVHIRDRLTSLGDELTLAAEGYIVMILERYYETRMVSVAEQIVADGLERKTTVDEARSALRELTCRADKLAPLPQDREIFTHLFEDLTDHWEMA